MRKKDLIELGITGVLLVVLILAFANAAKKPATRKAIEPNPVDLSGAGREDGADSGSLYGLLEQETKSIELKRDPFTAAPIVRESNAQSGFVLTGILWDKTNSLAIIDTEVVKKGDRLGKKTVADIKQDRVILNDGQEFIEIKLE